MKSRTQPIRLVYCAAGTTLRAWWRRALLSALLVQAHTLSAQVLSLPVATGDVSVHVVDAADAPVVSAEIMLRGDKGRTVLARTDSAGLATFAEVADGLWVMTVRRLGVKPTTNAVRIAAGQNAYTVRMDNAITTLVGVRVVGGRIYSPRLDDFERRRLAGLPNAVVSREQIEHVGPVALSRMLRGMAGLRIGDSLGSTVAISTRGNKPTRTDRTGFALVQCVMRVSIDGILLPALSNIDDIVPSEVHGIEVYYGPSRMPPELAGLRTDNWCGLIAVWTQDR